MRRLAALAAIGAALLLSGCYESKALLLDARQAATPLAVGHQTLADEGEHAERTPAPGAVPAAT